MPEHAYAKGSPSDPALSARASSAAESIYDARCQADSCCQMLRECKLQHCSIRDTVSDSQGGCQRSTPGSPSSCCSPTCLDRTQGTLHQILAVFSVPLIIACPIF